MRSIVGLFFFLPLALGQSHLLGQKDLTCVPGDFLRGYDPITLFYPKDAGPENGGPLDRPDGVVDLTPDHPGEWRWLDARTLQFSPTIPWPALETFSIEAGRERFTRTTFMAAPVDMAPKAGQSQLDPLTDLTFWFPYPLDPMQLANMVTIEVRDLPGLASEADEIITRRDFNIKSLERASLNDRAAYIVQLNRPIGYGKAIDVVFRLATSGDRSLAKYRMSTKPKFQLTAVGTGHLRYPIAASGSQYSTQQVLEAGTHRTPLFLEFSAQPADLSVPEMKRLVQFEPEVRELHLELVGNRVLLQFECERETLYRLSLRHTDIVDTAGRTLDAFEPSRVFFSYKAPTPFLNWQQVQGVVERYGPQELPLEGNGVDAVDVRIYKVNALDRNFWPFPNRGLVVNEDTRPPGPGEEPEYAQSMAQQIQILGSPLDSQVVPTPLKQNKGETRFGLDISTVLSKISGKNQPGTYLIGMRQLGTDTNRRYVRVQVTDLNLTTVEEEGGVVFFATSLRKAEPLAGVEVVVEGPDEADGTRHIVFKGTTGVDGMVRFEHREASEIYVARISARLGADYLVIDPDNPPPVFQDNHWYGMGARFLSWLSNTPQAYKKEVEYRAFIAPERPMYRPEDEVHIKGYIRTITGNKLEIPDGGTYTLEIQGPGDNQWSYPLEVTPYGSFYHRFQVDDPPTGAYDITIHEVSGDFWMGYARFEKEAYRIPRFEVLLDGPDEVPLDRPFQIDLTAEFYAGGRVADHEVRWAVTPFAYRFQPKLFPGFLFSSDERFRGSMPPISQETQQHFARTDEHGSASIEIDPSEELESGARRYIVEATVQGADEQTVTATKRVLALPPFAIGIKTERLLKDTTVLRPETIVLGFDGEPLAGHNGRLRVYRREWHSSLIDSDFTTGPAKYQTDVVDQMIEELAFTSEAKAVVHQIDVKESGVYVLELSARDQLGRLQLVTADVLILGDTPIAWEKKKDLVFDVVWDQKRYEPGDTAQLVLKSPFQSGRALVVVEDKDETLYQWVSIANGQGVYKLQVKPEMAPRIPVYVLAMRGRLKGETSDDQLLRPKTVGSSSWLNVKPLGYQLQLNLTHPTKNLPGSTMTVGIELKDPEGAPLDGEVTLWLVDRAVLALSQEMDLDPVPAFLREGYRWTRIRDGRNDVWGAFPLEESPGGDGAPRSEESLFDQVTVRKNFKTVPYYNHSIEVRNGVAEVEVALPDNLTEFAVRAIATDGKSRFGWAKSRLAIRLPVIVQTALPRFVRPGDLMVAGGIGRVVEGLGGEGRVAFDVTGLKAKDDLTSNIQWQPNTPLPLLRSFEVTQMAAAPGENPTNIMIKMAVERSSDAAKDAFQVSLPVMPDRPWTFEQDIRLLEPETKIDVLNPGAAVVDGTLRRSMLVAADPALVRVMVGLDYLRRYPHGCAEQRVSRLYPEIAMAQWLDKIGAKSRVELLKQWMVETTQFLLEAQNDEGLFGYWPGSRGYVGLTAYVVDFLLEAKDAGFQVDAQMLARAMDALDRSLRSDSRTVIQSHAYGERSAALAVLARAGKMDQGYAFELAARGRSMDLESEARILRALAGAGLQNDVMTRMVDDLEKSLEFTNHQGVRVLKGLQYRSRSWGGPLHSSEVKTLAEVARGLGSVNPQHEALPLLKTAILERGQGDGWGSTNANAAAMIALKEMMESGPAIGGQLSLTRSDGSSRTVDLGATAFVSEDISEAFKGPMTLKSADKAVLVWQRLQYLPMIAGKNMKPQTNGFAVSRDWRVYGDSLETHLNVKDTDAHELSVGQVVEDHTRVVNPEDRFYVAIEVPFAAGLDPLNPRLATAPPEANPSQSNTLEPSYVRFTDDRITYYYDELPAGTYDFYLRLKAMFAGAYTQPPARAELMYQLSVNGHSRGQLVMISGRE